MLNDADCGFCMRTGRLVPRLGVDIDSSTVQAADLEALGVDPVRAVVEMPYVHPRRPGRLRPPRLRLDPPHGTAALAGRRDG